MATRNWWIEVVIDGRKHKLTGGPQAKDGGFSVVIYQRDKGESVEVMRLAGDVLPNGRLRLDESKLLDYPHDKTFFPQPVLVTER